MFKTISTLIIIFDIGIAACGYTGEVTTYAQAEPVSAHVQPFEGQGAQEISPEEYLPIISIDPADDDLIGSNSPGSYVIVDTGQGICYSNDQTIYCPKQD